MKVTFVMLGLRDHSTGGYAFNFRMADALEAAGHTVDVIHYQTIPEKARGSRLHGSLHVLRRVMRNRPDLLVVSKSYSFMAPLRLLLPLLRTPVLYMVHHLEWHDREDNVTGSRKRLVRWFVSSGDRVWVNSGCTASDVCALGIPIERLAVIPPGYDPFPVPPYQERELPVKLLSVGTLCPRKDQITLLNACLSLDRNDYQLHLLGDEAADPAYSARVRELAGCPSLRDRVFFHGHLSVEGLREFYGSSHVLVNPSRWEGYGMAVVEALQSGLPVVAADAGAVPELVESGVDGFLFPPGDAAALAGCLEKLISSGTLRNDLSIRALEKAGKLFTWADTEREFVSLAESLGEKGGGIDP